MRNRIDNPDPAHSKWSAYCSIYLSDSDADGRQQGSDVLRVSGKVDGVRLPKSCIYVYRVMQNAPDSTSSATGLIRRHEENHVCRRGHCDQVELFLNGKSLGVASKPFNFVDTFGGRTAGADEIASGTDTGYIYAFPNVAFEPGSLKAVATKTARSSRSRNSRPPANPSHQAHGAYRPQACRPTAATWPVDFEVVDAQGRRCPTDEARVDFDVTGPAIWRGGFNAAKLNSTNNLYLDTECGINRVAIRSTLTPGTITLTATREGLKPATIEIKSVPVATTAGLSMEMPKQLPSTMAQVRATAP